MINLTLKERLTFIDYCRQEADTGTTMLGQMDKIHTPESLKKRERAKVTAFRIVLLELSTQTESYSVGPEDIGELPPEEGMKS